MTPHPPEGSEGNARIPTLPVDLRVGFGLGQGPGQRPQPAGLVLQQQGQGRALGAGRGGQQERGWPGQRGAPCEECLRVYPVGALSRLRVLAKHWRHACSRDPVLAMGQVLVSLGNRGPERWSNLPKVTQPVSGRAGRHTRTSVLAAPSLVGHWTGRRLLPHRPPETYRVVSCGTLCTARRPTFVQSILGPIDISSHPEQQDVPPPRLAQHLASLRPADRGQPLARTRSLRRPPGGVA